MTIPMSETELLQRAGALAGRSLADLGAEYGVKLPQNLRRAKGFVGQFIETLLGASAASKAEPDFPNLGIELKTIPIDAKAKPLESTFVTTIALLKVNGQTWHSSAVYKKLRHVLWVPIIINECLAERRVGQPLLWQPSASDERILAQDWQELTDLISFGHISRINARLGHYLQVRPKGADGKALVWGVNEQGHKELTLPRGFYLRTKFTQKILAEHFLF
jgi:DNA mismatch repair protein MutH